jgi:hypothetical protein
MLLGDRVGRRSLSVVSSSRLVLVRMSRRSCSCSWLVVGLCYGESMCPPAACSSAAGGLVARGLWSLVAR